MEKDRVEIKLNSPTNTYFTGQEITGQICFTLTKKTKIRAIHLQVCAKGKCKWVEMFRKDSYGNIHRSVFYSGKEVFLNDTVNVPFVPSRGIELAPGEFAMDFTYLLAKDLPSSFKGSYGSIKYKLKVVIQKPWTFDEKYTIPLTIVRHILSPPITAISPPEPHICQTTRNVSVFGCGPISLVAELPNNCIIQNEKVTLLVTVDNRSSTHVEKLRFTIVQKVRYLSMKPLSTYKIEYTVVFTKETGGVEKKSDRSFAHDLLVPACPPSHLTRIFNISYTLNVEAILPAFYKNLSLSFPVFVYSGDGNKPPGNPFEGGDESVAFPVCNRLSSYISTSSSPAHSQIQNESESSSLYSTTSESSTATLSPAPRSTEQGTLNRGSRNRSSMAYPYSPVPGQSLETQCEQFPDIADIIVHEIHSPACMYNSYPPPNIATLPHFVQSCHRVEVQARYPINELPPSYEELFGNASSHPPSAPSAESPV